MAGKLFPTRVKIDGKWYNAREGFGSTTGMLELSDSGKIALVTEFTAKEPFMHISNLYHVFDTDGNKVGEFDINNKTCSGRVSDFDAPGSSSASSYSDSTSGQKEMPSGCFGWVFFIIGGWFFFIFKSNWGGKIGLIFGVILTIIFIAVGGGADGLNTILLCLFMILILGTVGAGIGALIKGISKLANKSK